jgi:hypothetical protein
VNGGRLHGTRCPECDTLIGHIGDGLGSVDPLTFEQVFTCHPCGHRVDREYALVAHGAGVRVFVPKVSAASLGAAEQARARAKGHTVEEDSKLTGAQLAWATYCLVQEASSEASEVIPSPEPPAVWPKALGVAAWPADEPAIRQLVIALGYLMSEVDRRLAAGEKP